MADNAKVPDEVRIGVPALRADAAEWRDTATRLKNAQAVVSTLDLTDHQYSLDKFFGAYEAVRATAERLLGEGHDNLTRLAQSLEKLANDFAAEDDAATKELQDVFEFRLPTS